MSASGRSAGAAGSAGGDLLRQRANLAAAAAVDIDEVVERGVGAFAVGDVDGLVKIAVFLGGQAGAFHQGDLVDAVGGALGEHGQVVLHALREAGFFQPAAREGVAFEEHDERVQPHRLQARSVQQRQVEAGAEVLGFDGVAHPDALADVLKAGGWVAVGDGFLRDGAVQRGHLPPDGVGVLALVPGERRVAVPLAQNAGGALHQPRDVRVIRRDERRHHLRNQRRAAPFVVRKDGDILRGLGEDGFVLPDGDAQRAAHALRERKQVAGRQLQIHRQLHRLSGGQHGDVRGPFHREHRVAGDGHGEVGEGGVAGIVQQQLPDDRHMVLLHGQVDDLAAYNRDFDDAHIL